MTFTLFHNDPDNETVIETDGIL